jgi:YebC/PmpR family DNA-binding regulatory protein
MAGHSKWANIKHRKAAVDKKRGAAFTKLARAITSAAREGGGDPDMNFSLRLAVDKARAANMPKDNIDRAILRGAGGAEGEAMEVVTYEGYGPGGVAIMVVTTTDNRNRTAGQVRSSFAKHGGNLGESGVVAWQFELRGTINIPAEDVDSEMLALDAIDAGALDVEVDEELVVVYTEVPDFQRVKLALDKAGYDTSDSELAMIPTTQMSVENKIALRVLRLIEVLEDFDDTDQVWSNLEITDEVAALFDEA